ncbi:hypothetical protein ScPMuIL_003254 [Solemya velum]
MAAYKDELQSTHFSFGNYKSKKLSTYWCDYDCSKLPMIGAAACRPPSPAQVLPNPDLQNERNKWLSSSRRDFTCFSTDINRKIYQESVQEFHDTKVFQTRGNLWPDEDHVPPLTSAHKDYSEPIPPTNQHRVNFLRDIQTKNRNKQIYRIRPSLVSEARHAFQWPIARINPASLFRKPTKSA